MKSTWKHMRFVSLHLCLFSLHAVHSFCRPALAHQFFGTDRILAHQRKLFPEVQSWSLFSPSSCLSFSWEEQTDNNPTLNTNKTEQHFFQLSHAAEKYSVSLPACFDLSRGQNNNCPSVFIKTPAVPVGPFLTCPPGGLSPAHLWLITNLSSSSLITVSV